MFKPIYFEFKYKGQPWKFRKGMVVYGWSALPSRSEWMIPQYGKWM